jgi:NAD(P)-dependent dehydrogenase (short-subunit alcohol dehydrogenase family)
MSGGGRTAIVTGGSRGFGRALALGLARRGWTVHATGRTGSALRELERDSGELTGTVCTHRSDVSSSDDNAALVRTVSSDSGHITAVIHNAGLLGPPRTRLADYPPDEFARVLAANVFGPFDLTRQLIPHLARGAALFFMSSGASLGPRRGWGAYNVSKMALDGLAGIWALELRDSGIRVITVDPGKMRTAMRAAAYPDEDPQTLATPEEKARRLIPVIEDPTNISIGERIDI